MTTLPKTKLRKLTYAIALSAAIVGCADAQLSSDFESLLGNGELPSNSEGLRRFFENLEVSENYYWRDKSGKSMLQWMIEWQETRLVHKLMNEDAILHLDPEHPLAEVLISAIETDNLDYTKLVVESAEENRIFPRLDINEALYWSLITNRRSAVDYLLSKGARIDEVFTTHEDLLIEIIGSDFPDMAWFIIENGAKPDSRNANGETALGAAVMRNNLRLVEFLLGQGLKINDEENSTGLSPFELAISNFSKRNEGYALVDLLIRKGGNICDAELKFAQVNGSNIDFVALPELLATAENPEFKSFAHRFNCSSGN